MRLNNANQIKGKGIYKTPPSRPLRTHLRVRGSNLCQQGSVVNSTEVWHEISCDHCKSKINKASPDAIFEIFRLLEDRIFEDETNAKVKAMIEAVLFP